MIQNSDSPPRLRRQSVRTMMNPVAAPSPSSVSAEIQTNRQEAIQIDSDTDMQADSSEPIQGDRLTDRQAKGATPKNRMKTGYSLDRGLIKQAKHLAADEEKDVNDLIEEGLRLVFAARKQQASQVGINTNDLGKRFV